MLGRGTAPGLEVVPREAGKAEACCTGTQSYQDGEPGDEADPSGAVSASNGTFNATTPSQPWVLLEPLMAENEVVVLIGESLGRLTGGAFPPCLHRVVDNVLQRARINIAFELRPAKAVYSVWETMQPTPTN